jgi:hypothetical protein
VIYLQQQLADSTLIKDTGPGEHNQMGAIYLGNLVEFRERRITDGLAE